MAVCRRPKGINRAHFLAATAAAGLAATLLPAGTARAARTPRGLRPRGVVYTVGAGETPATGFSPTRMRRDFRVIRDELHADTCRG
ncbi:hypothetical protein [Streptomyces sp. NPDC007905]|uniref:hypothetical protein n=1 Tax=Streptomyces sp. NPDC007905 TaxID=3364788 RepID=UPI0036E7590C